MPACGVFVCIVVLPVGFFSQVNNSTRHDATMATKNDKGDDIMQHLFQNKKDDSINYSPHVRKMFDHLCGLEFGYVFSSKEGLF